MLLMHIDFDGTAGQRAREHKRSENVLTAFFLSKKPKVAESCTTSAAALLKAILTLGAVCQI